NCLQDASFPDKINQIISKNNILASDIELEITESALMSDLSRARQILDQLHELGFKISIDDFGTGFSSLAYLKQLPVDVLKIDRSFVEDMKNNKSDAAIVNTIIQLAHSLNCKVVAEGIEDAETYDLLKELNNDIAQGYLISRPIPANDLEQWLETSVWKPRQSVIEETKLSGT
ncbi:MAG: EAL domain-containing protein, partial [Gammaproteobacteria bacterium]|nr:EAL domain-containing protein [Gammaproteobacteria bacterium]